MNAQGKTPLVSAIMAVYNGEKYVQAAVESSRLRVLHVHHDMRRGSGGQKSVGEIIRGVDPKRFRSLLVILVRRLEMPEMDLDGIEIVPITGRHPGTPWWKELRFARTLGRFIAREGIDIVHTHEDTGYRLGVVAAQIGRARVIRTHEGVMASTMLRIHPFNDEPGTTGRPAERT